MNYNNNPYTLMFGESPSQLIARPAEAAQLIQAFCKQEQPQKIYMITGIRGSGKTVLMSEVSKKISSLQDWIVVELNPERDLLQALAAKLSSHERLAALFHEAKINLSFFGLSAEIKGTAPIRDIETALSRMLKTLHQKGKRVLVTIDEVTSNEHVRVFAAAFQILIRQNLPLFLLMTGLYENIYKLQNEPSLTFLYRAPKIELGPLNLGTIASNYRRNMTLEPDRAREMAQLTCGYSFAFQVLGFYTWEHDGMYEEALDEYRQYLEDYVYDKIWSELSAKDRTLAYAVAVSTSGKVAEILQKLGIENSQLSPYRKRLIRKGVLDGSQFGYLRFTLPLFGDYVQDVYPVDEMNVFG